jgi:hypothetical protein
MDGLFARGGFPQCNAWFYQQNTIALAQTVLDRKDNLLTGEVRNSQVRLWLEDIAGERGMSLLEFIGKFADSGRPEALDWMRAYLFMDASNAKHVRTVMRASRKALDDDRFFTYIMREVPVEVLLRILIATDCLLGTLNIPIERLVPFVFPLNDPERASLLSKVFGSKQFLLEAARTAGLEKPFSDEVLKSLDLKY